MKKPKILKRATSGKKKPEKFWLDGLVKKTVDKMRKGKISENILIRKSNQKNVYNVKFSLSKPMDERFYTKLKLYLKKEGLMILDGQILNRFDAKKKDLYSISFRVRYKPSKVDLGNRSKNTFKKVLAFIGEV